MSKSKKTSTRKTNTDGDPVTNELCKARMDVLIERIEGLKKVVIACCCTTTTIIIIVQFILTITTR